MTVPSTIASYYPDATAAFVLSSGLDYFIEPRTPLFQDTLRNPRASHYTLASWLGKTVRDHVGERPSPDAEVVVEFPPSFYSPNVCAEVVESMVSAQQSYGKRAQHVTDKLERYRKLLVQATGRALEPHSIDESRGPKYVLCPYFAVHSRRDAWWTVMNRIWEAASGLADANVVSPVVAISNLAELVEAIETFPDSLSQQAFYWIPGLNERNASVQQLVDLKDAIGEASSRRDLINLYGGYFSILLGRYGLSGFSNGLGYSESRDWPTLEATGAAPARYYVPRLHAFISAAAAQVLVSVDQYFFCSCSVCDSGRRNLNDLGYHELKRHFALTRGRELEECRWRDIDDISVQLKEDAARVNAIRYRIPSDVNLPSDHLVRWSTALVM